MVTIKYPTKKIVEKKLSYILKKDIILNGPDNKLWEIAEDISNNNPDQYGQLDLGIGKLSGIDIPILLSNGNDHEDRPRPIVAIVAQDPYRNNGDDLLNGIDKKNKTIVGTPFAFHYEEDAYPKTKVYRKIIKSLLNKYDVYLTDAHKIYSNPEWKYEKGDKQKEKNLLLEEINELSPQLVLVVGFGGEAHTYIKDIKGSISLLHPSQTNWDHWRLWIYEQAYNNTSNYEINWTEYANKLTVRNNMFGSKNEDNLEDIISDIILDIIKKRLEKMK